MGKKEREERVEKRENYATRRSSEKRRNMLITLGVLAVIVVIIGYSAWQFVNMTEKAPGGPEGAGQLNSEHSHAALLVSVFGDTFDFSAQAYQIKSPWIHFEGGDGTTIHKHATGVKLGYLFSSLKLKLDDKCFVFQDGRSFCSNDENSLKFYINREQIKDIRNYETKDNDRILVVYGAETPEEIEGLLLKLDSQPIKVS